MKPFKITYLILAILVILTPICGLALEEMNDIEMNDVTGQMGVTMSFQGDLEAQFRADGIAWGDSNGFAGANGPGYIMFGRNTASFIMHDGGELTVDISSGGVSIPGGGNIPAGAGCIRIGLPDIDINYEFIGPKGDHKTAISLVGGSATQPNWGAAGANNAIGYLWVEDFRFSIDNGVMYIVPH